MKAVPADSANSLTHWVSQAIGVNALEIQVRFRGNDLHILCEGEKSPPQWRTVLKLIQALQKTSLDSLTSTEQPPVYQVFIYGRRPRQKLPDWCQRLYLNQLDQHLVMVRKALAADTESNQEPGGALLVPNQILARQGQPEAIARYLSETLSTLGVAVEVKVRSGSKSSRDKGEKRLWILCQSEYSPDAALIAEPIAQQLRELGLKGYRDAAIASQVSGETKPDWMLRVDLTPREEMLKEWARWGDVQTISQLLNEAISGANIEVQASLKEATLHLICMAVGKKSPSAAPEKMLCLEKLVPVLEAIAPQGVQAATLYGQTPQDDTPAWIEWLTLPAAEYPALAEPPLKLAVSGDEPALTFLLSRLLNPNIERRLATGGIRVLIARKQDLLHVMCDAPLCPQQKSVAPKVAKFVRQLKIKGLKGVRVYGRRAGNKEPFWSYGADFQQRPRLVPEATPEFAATVAYVDQLVPAGDSESILRPDLTREQVTTAITKAIRAWCQATRNLLLKSQLFTETDQPSKQIFDYQGAPVALVWATLGILLTLQADWVIGQIVNRPPQEKPPEGIAANQRQNRSQSQQGLGNSTGKKSGKNSAAVFNASGFTATDNSPSQSFVATPTQKLTSTTPTFNSRQLDEQLALYRHRLIEKGNPPDVMIIGSSRALRGVDPVALSRALATQGYPNLDIFNFGINGATAQVVDLLVRRILTESELPKLIIWADGARAFNSGREDVTFNAIAASPGYKQVLAKLQDTSPSPTPASSPTTSQTPNPKPPDTPLAASYQTVNDWLTNAFAGISATYPQRDQLKTVINQKFQSFVSSDGTPESPDQNKPRPGDAEADLSPGQSVDFDGFLPLSIRFNPTTYYKQHPKVSGDYDNDYKDFRLGGQQEAAMQALLKHTQARSIPVVFVNTPLTQTYLDPVRNKHEQEFQEYMLRNSTRQGFIYRNLSLLWPKAHDYFSDPSHLNRYGAYEVSKKLASDPMIPWFTK